MAFKITITEDNGVQTNYHRITQTNFTIAEFDGEEKKLLSTRITSYMNEDYRDLNKPVSSLYYNFRLEPEEEVDGDIRALAYEKLKTVEPWKDAEDC